MKKYLKYLVFLAILSYTTIWAGMIEVTDDDRYQYLEFSGCIPDSLDSIIIGDLIYPDSGYGYVETAHVITDTVYYVGFGYISPDTNVNGDLIPGHYEGEYWFYVISVLPNGDHVLPEDTTHVVVDYTISGCGGLFHVD